MKFFARNRIIKPEVEKGTPAFLDESIASNYALEQVTRFCPISPEISGWVVFGVNHRRGTDFRKNFSKHSLEKFFYALRFDTNYQLED
jgi:hypothetical protein